MKRFLIAFFLLASPILADTVAYHFEGYDAGTPLTSTAGGWGFYPFVSSTGGDTATIEYNGDWNSYALKIVSGGAWRTFVGTMENAYMNTSGITATAQAGGSDRATITLFWDGEICTPVGTSPHPYNGIVFQHRPVADGTRLTKWTNGANTTLTNTTHTVSDIDDYVLEARAHDNGDLELYLDGTFIISANDTTHDVGGIGLFNFGASGEFFDAITITADIATPTNTPTITPTFTPTATWDPEATEAFYEFEGDVTDSSNNGYDGTNSGSTGFENPATCGNGQAIGKFTSSNAVDLPAGLNTAMSGWDTFTIEFYFIVESYPATGQVFWSCGTNDYIWIPTASKDLHWIFSGDDRKNSFTIDLDTCYYVACVADGADRRIFIQEDDGETFNTPDYSGATGQTLPTITAQKIGNYTAGNFPIDGYIDNFRISNIARGVFPTTPPTAASTNQENLGLKFDLRVRLFRLLDNVILGRNS